MHMAGLAHERSAVPSVALSCVQPKVPDDQPCGKAAALEPAGVAAAADAELATGVGELPPKGPHPARTTVIPAAAISAASRPFTAHSLTAFLPTGVNLKYRTISTMFNKLILERKQINP